MNKYWVIDTNILISALLRPDGNERKALIKARETGIVLLSENLRNEYFQVLSRNKFDKYVSIETRLELYSAICDEAIQIYPTRKISENRDPKDNMLLELAVEAKAYAIITGDQDLLVMNPFEDIPIISALDFLKI